MTQKEMIERMIKEQPGLAEFERYLEWAYMIGFEASKRCLSTQKGVYQLNDRGDVVNKFGSIGDAMRKTGITRNNISGVCAGKRHSAGGYHWRYSD